jgi:hypothetical protein
LLCNYHTWKAVTSTYGMKHCQGQHKNV